MPTLPRHCLVGFADYKQKDEDVNAICRLVPHLIVPEADEVIALRTFSGIAL